MKILHEIYKFYVPDSYAGRVRIHTFVVLSDNNVYLLFMGNLVDKYTFAEQYSYELQAFTGARFKLPITYDLAVEAFEYGEQWCSENYVKEIPIITKPTML